MFNRVYLLPKALDRQFSLREKLSVWLFGDSYWDSEQHGIMVKPYALARRFNKDGYTTNNPYFVEHFTGNCHYLIGEEYMYNRDVVVKSEKARQLKEEDDQRVIREIEAMRKLPGTGGGFF